MSTAFDIRNPEIVAHQLQEANQRLARVAEPPTWLRAFIRDLSDDLASADAADVGAAPDEWIAIQSAALRAQGVLLEDEEDERAQRRKLRLIVEELRFRLSRLAEQQPVNEDRPIKELAVWFERVVPVAHNDKAALFDVSGRTWERWASDAETAAPTGDAETLLRLLARLVYELRHTLSAGGAYRWAHKPLPDLDGRSALDVFTSGDPADIRRVFSLVGSVRSGAAA